MSKQARVAPSVPQVEMSARDADSDPGGLRQAIAGVVGLEAVSFTRLIRALPALRGTGDLSVTPNVVLWRGLSEAGIAAIKGLYGDGALFFWLCSPAIYGDTGDAPFLPPMTRSRRGGEKAWLSTLVSGRAATEEESRLAAREYVAEIARNAAVGASRVRQSLDLFDYDAAADLYVASPARPPSQPVRAQAAAGGRSRIRAPSGRRMTYRRFSTGAEAIRFVIEEQPEAMLLAAAIESGGERFEGTAIRMLYESDRYPLARRARRA